MGKYSMKVNVVSVFGDQEIEASTTRELVEKYKALNGLGDSDFRICRTQSSNFEFPDDEPMDKTYSEGQTVYISELGSAV